MTHYFKCEICTEIIKKEVDYLLTFDISEVTYNNYLDNAKNVMHDKTLDEIKEIIHNELLQSRYICNSIEHVRVVYGNDGPFIEFTDKNGIDKSLCSILLNHENDTFRIFDED